VLHSSLARHRNSRERTLRTARSEHRTALPTATDPSLMPGLLHDRVTDPCGDFFVASPLSKKGGVPRLESCVQPGHVTVCEHCGVLEPREILSMWENRWTWALDRPLTDDQRGSFLAKEEVAELSRGQFRDAQEAIARHRKLPKIVLYARELRVERGLPEQPRTAPGPKPERKPLPAPNSLRPDRLSITKPPSDWRSHLSPSGPHPGTRLPTKKSGTNLPCKACGRIPDAMSGKCNC
jgi:hypothetical protein